MWLICISETSDLIQSSTVHWESAYMCTKSFLHEKIMSYFSSFVCECASPTYHYVKWNYEYGCWYSMAMSLNIQCPMVKWFCLMMFFLIWIAALLPVFFIKWKLLTWIRYTIAYWSKVLEKRGILASINFAQYIAFLVRMNNFNRWSSGETKNLLSNNINFLASSIKSVT